MGSKSVLVVVAVTLLTLTVGISQNFVEMELDSSRQFQLNFAEKTSHTDIWATPAGGAGSDMVWDMVLDSSGNSFVTGSFSGSATFGSTILNSVGGLDGFVAKMDTSGNWVWASHIAGGYEDWGLGIDIDPQGNVYVTGPFMDSQSTNSPSVTLGSTTLSAHAQSNYDIFITKLDSNGNFLWAETSKKIEILNENTWTYEEQMGQVMPTDIKFFNNSISVSGSYNGKLWAHTDSQGEWYYESTQGTSDVWLGFLEANGAWSSTAAWGGDSQFDSATAIAPSPTGNYWYVAGNFAGTVEFPGGATISSSGGSQDVWVMLVDDGGSVQWTKSGGGTGRDVLRNLVVDSNDSVYAVGEFDGVLASYGNDRLTANSGGTDVWAGKLDVGGSWLWAKKGGGSSDDMGFSIALSADESAVFTAGQIAGMTNFENSATTRMANTSGASDAFVAVSSAATGEWEDVFVAGGPSGGDRAWAIAVDSQNVTITSGRFKGTASGPAEFGSDDIVSAGDFDVFVWKGLIEDDDDDRVANEDDDCPTVWGNATVSPYIGCPDADGDGYADVDDSHPSEPTQWRDQDGDGYGDNPDGFAADNCTTIHGTSTIDLLGCVDSDSDGWSNVRDAFPTEPTQWNDSDGDQFGDNWDDEALTPTYQSLGLGGYVFGAVNMDYCPTLPGVDTFDNPGCPDTDGDGWSDVTDDFINNPTQHLDTDGDGWGDNHSAGSTQSDYLPFDETQYQDQDGDGWGDNQEGNNPDTFPLDETQQTDIDGDGYGDNLSGNNGDACPDVWGDSWRDRLGCPDVDGDGASDEGDAFPSDWSQWVDSDGDGWSDDYDIFKDDSTQWRDTDRDGFGDEPSGMNGDDCPTIRGDSEHDRLGCPDTDTDGWSDPMDTLSPNPWNTSQGADLFPADPARWNQSHVVDASNSAASDGGLAAGIGLGALIAMMFVMVFVIIILKFRQKDEYEEYEDEEETEDDEDRTSRAAEISRSWQEHGTAPPPPPEGAEMITATDDSTPSTTSYVAPPPPTADNTLSTSASVQIPTAPEPPSEPLQTGDEEVMDSMDTNLAMSLLGSSDGSEVDEESESKDESLDT